MKKTPKNFILLSILTFVILAILEFNLIPLVAAAYSSTDIYVGIALCIASAAFGLAGGYSLGKIGAAAVSALVEKPNLFVRLLMLVALAEAIAIYGLVLGFLAYTKL